VLRDALEMQVGPVGQSHDVKPGRAACAARRRVSASQRPVHAAARAARTWGMRALCGALVAHPPVQKASRRRSNERPAVDDVSERSADAGGRRNGAEARKGLRRCTHCAQLDQPRRRRSGGRLGNSRVGGGHASTEADVASWCRGGR
jgi:hypothetical protein